MNRKLFSGIQETYTLENSCNILVITRILGFTSDLDNIKDIALVLGYNLYIHLCNSYNMGTSSLPDMYARSPRAAGLRAEGIHIRQSTSAHVTLPALLQSA